MNMHEFLDLDKDFHTLFANSFTFRPAYKTVCLVAGGVVGLVLLLFALLAMQRIVQFVGRKR